MITLWTLWNINERYGVNRAKAFEQWLLYSMPRCWTMEHLIPNYASLQTTNYGHFMFVRAYVYARLVVSSHEERKRSFEDILSSTGLHHILSFIASAQFYMEDQNFKTSWNLKAQLILPQAKRLRSRIFASGLALYRRMVLQEKALLSVLSLYLHIWATDWLAWCGSANHATFLLLHSSWELCY